jgi:hypothetical protein
MHEEKKSVARPESIIPGDRSRDAPVPGRTWSIHYGVARDHARLLAKAANCEIK